MQSDTSSRHLSILTAAAIAVRIAFIFLCRLDSDEPQHLHVAWGWSRGLVQYRDVFDNHFPLLHLVYAPLMRFMPESSAVFLWMRFAIAPFAIAAAWLLYRIACPLLGTRQAAIAAITYSVLPPWLPKSVEFRNDTLWIFFWLAALALIIGRPRPAYFLAGIAGALCLLASVKALPLLLAHSLALVSQRQSLSTRIVWRTAVGFAMPLVAMALFLYTHRALAEGVYATLLFNASLPISAARRIGGGVAFAIVAPFLALNERGTRAGHLALFGIWYAVLLVCFWPIVGPRDLLPLVPVASMLIAATRIARVAPIAVFLAATLASVRDARLWQPRDPAREAFVDAAARLTTPDEAVFDLKGDAIFRRRPVHYIYDIVGRTLTGNGTLLDQGPEEIIASGTCVAIGDSAQIPPRTRAFLNMHFLDVGPARVCGSITRDGAFSIAVPQRYAVIANAKSGVVVDGVPYTDPRFLAAGRHTLTAPRNEPATVLWWRALRSDSYGFRERSSSRAGTSAECRGAAPPG